MAYTPELPTVYSGALRRLAWAMQVPMTTAIEEIIEYSARVVDRGRVCTACKDNSFCEHCIFNGKEGT